MNAPLPLTSNINHFPIVYFGIKNCDLGNIFNFRLQSPSISLSCRYSGHVGEEGESFNQNNKDSSQGVEFIILDIRFILYWIRLAFRWRVERVFWIRNRSTRWLKILYRNKISHSYSNRNGKESWTQFIKNYKVLISFLYSCVTFLQRVLSWKGNEMKCRLDHCEKVLFCWYKCDDILLTYHSRYRRVSLHDDAA